MATSVWKVYQYSSNTGANSQTSTAVTWRINVPTAGALAWGGGSRSSGHHVVAPLTAIQIGTFGSTLHVLSSATSVVGSGNNGGYRDLCSAAIVAAAGHAHVVIAPISVLSGSSATKYYIDTAATIVSIDATHPPKAAVTHFWFQYQDPGTTPKSVQVTACQLWSYNNTSVNSKPPGSTIYVVECSAGAGKSWSSPYPASKLSLATKTAATAHNWYVAISPYASAVGFSTAGRVKIEATFQ